MRVSTHASRSYVYPDSLNFDDYSGSGKHRNISVNVRFKDTDAQPTDPGLKKIYGKSHSPNFVTEANTAVTYHAKKPQFPNEVPYARFGQYLDH